MSAKEAMIRAHRQMREHSQVGEESRGNGRLGGWVEDTRVLWCNLDHGRHPTTNCVSFVPNSNSSGNSSQARVRYACTPLRPIIRPGAPGWA